MSIFHLLRYIWFDCRMFRLTVFLGRHLGGVVGPAVAGF